MLRFFKWTKKEVLQLLPPFIFFFLFFNLLNTTENLMGKREGLKAFSFLTVLIASAIVAKVFLTLEFLPLVNAFLYRPLIYNVIWKTFLCGILSLIIRILDSSGYLFLNNTNIEHQSFIMSINWTQFWTIQT
jgi:hypothetical protein